MVGYFLTVCSHPKNACEYRQAVPASWPGSGYRQSPVGLCGLSFFAKVLPARSIHVGFLLWAGYRHGHGVLRLQSGAAWVPDI